MWTSAALPLQGAGNSRDQTTATTVVAVVIKCSDEGSRKEASRACAAFFAGTKVA